MLKQKKMEMDFSPLCILTLKFLILHLITAKVMLFFLTCVPWKAFQATISITKGLENNRWIGMVFWILEYIEKFFKLYVSTSGASPIFYIQILLT